MYSSVSIVAACVQIIVKGDPSWFLLAIAKCQGGSSVTRIASLSPFLVLSSFFLFIKVATEPITARKFVQNLPSNVALKRIEVRLRENSDRQYA